MIIPNEVTLLIYAMLAGITVMVLGLRWLAGNLGEEE